MAPQPSVKTLTVEPSELTLPTGAFHYDPLLTLRDESGQPMWVDLPSEVLALSSNPQVATVNERVRIRTTGRAGNAEILIRSLADPSVKARLKLTTVDATIRQVRVEGPSDFQLYVGQAVPIEATAILSTGDLIPHVQYSSDLDLVTGSEYAAVVDGLGISALRASPPNTPIAIGFFRGGGSAAGTLSVREMQLVNAEIRLAGIANSTHDFKIPSGYQGRLEILGTFEDGTSRQLQFNQDYTVVLSGDPGFAFSAPGILSQPLVNQTATLQLDLPGTAHDLMARVRSVDGSLVTALSSEFANYPEDRRMLHLSQGYARELRVLADFPGLTGYRLSGLDPLTVNTAIASQGMSTNGWPTLTPTAAAGSGQVQITVGGISTTLSGVSVINPTSVTVSAVGKGQLTRLPLELGSHLSFHTLVDYGDGQRRVRTSDYPVAESAAQTPFVHVLIDTNTVFLNQARVYSFRARDASAQELPAVLEVDVTRQSDPD